MNHDTESTVRTLIADGKGILAADETPGTLTKRFDALAIQSTAQSRSPMKWRRARRAPAVRRDAMRGTTSDPLDLPAPSTGDRRA